MGSLPQTTPPAHHTVRLIDIAEQTGYSLATVSKTLNGRSDVSPLTKKVIVEALQRSGYSQPTRRRPVNRNIEVVFQTFENLWSLEVLRGALRAAKSYDVTITVTESGDRIHPDSSWADDIVQRQPLGAILIFSNLTAQERERLQSRHIAYVVFDPSGDPAPDDMSVQADNWTGGLSATRHLLSLGHTRIGIITGPDDMMCSRARLDGYAAALSEKGLNSDPSLITEGDFTTAGGYAQAMALLENPEIRPSAIFAGSDLQSMGVYEAARQLGIRIPEDLSVVGFDDVQTASYLGPSLTTVRQPLQDMAAAATRMIMGAEQGDTVDKHIIMPTTLMVRDSTCALRGE
ncbi:MAG: LacI family DNA-binding transcriptional regulator [Bifidobacterium psychraerophilum]|uniref:LacI family DNA-binding transcriptional regulator n=1 Tax=Bifidobacterium psychraerophilum TaxID=218140 RepID=UPI0039ED891E